MKLPWVIVRRDRLRRMAVEHAEAIKSLLAQGEVVSTMIQQRHEMLQAARAMVAALENYPPKQEPKA